MAAPDALHVPIEAFLRLAPEQWLICLQNCACVRARKGEEAGREKRKERARAHACSREPPPRECVLGQLGLSFVHHQMLCQVSIVCVRVCACVKKSG